MLTGTKTTLSFMNPFLTTFLSLILFHLLFPFCLAIEWPQSNQIVMPKGKINRPQCRALIPQGYAGIMQLPARLQEGVGIVTLLSTHGLGPCVGLAFYHEPTHTGLVAHFDEDSASLANEHISNLLQAFQIKAKALPSLVALVPGPLQELNPKLLPSLQAALDLSLKKAKSDVKGKILRGRNPIGTDFYLSLKNGDIGEYQEQFDESENVAKLYSKGKHEFKNTEHWQPHCLNLPPQLDFYHLGSVIADFYQLK